ncbi:MAG: hypothetical protein LC733_10165 [Actinobacteria bacterium]|nr:hypothetical protein [Actinomycetota bacterium]
MVNYITPTLNFSEDKVYTGVYNTAFASGSGFRPNGSHDLYFNNPDGSKRLLKTVTADATGAFAPTSLTLSAVGQPSSLSSTGYLHAFEPGRGTDPLWCVSTDPTTVVRSDPECPETGQQLNAHHNPGATVAACFDDTWPAWMVNAFRDADLRWRLTSSGSPRIETGGSCGLGDSFRLRFRSTSACDGQGVWYGCTALAQDGTGLITGFILTVNNQYCHADDFGNRTSNAEECFDILTTLAHELGHVRGLEHRTDRPDCTVLFYPQLPLPYKHRNPLAGDYKAMGRIYGLE